MNTLILNRGIRAFFRGTLLAVMVMSTLSVVPAWADKVKNTGVTPLSEEEADMLLYMREEEKLAHDVYVAMYESWEAKVFDQITDSEQKHMDTMLKKLVKYGLPDPALDEGVFTNEFLQGKYNELTAIGEGSYVAGLDVGATIEEIDMIDIQHAIDITSHVDVVNSYENLLEGSKNHLRAFVGALEVQGITYEPKYISQELFDAIMED